MELKALVSYESSVEHPYPVSVRGGEGRAGSLAGGATPTYKTMLARKNLKLIDYQEAFDLLWTHLQSLRLPDE